VESHVESHVVAAAPAPVFAPAQIVEAPVPAVETTVPATAVAPAPAAVPVTATAPPAPAAKVSVEGLHTMLESAGLVWVNTDASKFEAAAQSAAAVAQAPRVPRVRKNLPPLDTAPMQQVETARDDTPAQ
jgi:ribonuclease E